MVRRRFGVFPALCACLIGLAACSPGAPAPLPISPAETTLPTVTASSPLLNVIPDDAAIATPAPSLPAAMPAPTDPADPNIDPNEASARDIAAAAIGVAAVAVTVVEIVPMDWNDSSLGCPQPGYLYAQVITPGYKATVEISSKTYFVHMDASGQGILCTEEP